MPKYYRIGIIDHLNRIEEAKLLNLTEKEAKKRKTTCKPLMPSGHYAPYGPSLEIGPTQSPLILVKFYQYAVKHMS